MTDSSPAIRTEFRLDPERLSALLQGEARPLLELEVPLSWPDDETGEAHPLTEERSLELLFPADGDESLLSLLRPRSSHRDVLPGVSSVHLIERVHDEANRRGELWNPVLDLLAGDEVALSLLEEQDPADPLPTLSSRAGPIPSLLMAEVSQDHFDDILNHPRLRHFPADVSREREIPDPVVQEVVDRKALPHSGDNHLFSASHGGARALLLAPHLEAIRDTHELEHLVRSFHSASFRTMAALFTPVLSRRALLEFVQTPEALTGLLHNPEARDWLIREGGLEELARFAIRPEPGYGRGRGEDDHYQRDRLVRLVSVLSPHGAPPFSPELLRDLETERAQSVTHRPSPLKDDQLDLLLMANPANTADDLRSFVDGQRHRDRLAVLCHPSATPDVAELAFERPAYAEPDQPPAEHASRAPKAQDRAHAIRHSSYWRAAPEHAHGDPEAARARRRSFLHDLLDGSVNVTEVEAFAEAADADARLWHALMDRFPPNTPQGLALSWSLAKQDGVRLDEELVRRLFRDRYTGQITLLFDTANPEAWSRAAHVAAQHPEGFDALSDWLRGKSPPEGARLSTKILREMLGSELVANRRAAIRLVGEGFGHGDEGLLDAARPSPSLEPDSRSI